MTRKSGRTAAGGGCRDDAKGYGPFLCGVVVSVVLVGLLAGPAYAGSAENVKAADSAGQQQPAAEKDGAKAADQAKAEGAVVATVNGVAITRGSLQRMMKLVASEYAEERKSPPETKEVREKALHRLIFQELVYQSALHQHVTIAEKDVDAAIERIKEKAGGEEAYRKDLEKVSKTEEEERAAVKRFLAIKQLYERKISDKISVTEDDVKREYDREKDNFVVPESVSIVDVVFFLDTGKKESFEKAEKIRQKILADKDRNPMDLVPDGTFVARELTLKKDRDKELYREARKLKEGEVSGVIKTSDSLHIIQLKRYTPEKQFTLEQMRPFIERKLRAMAKLDLIKKWDAELRKDARIELTEPGDHE